MPRPVDSLARFPGPVAIVHGEGSPGPVAFLDGDAVNDEPWAIEATYQKSGRPCLVIRTVRSSRNMNPRGLPVEDATIQLVNFLSRVGRPLERELTAPSRASSRTVFDQVRVAVNGATVQDVEVAIDDERVRGTRTDALDAAVVELAWHGQVVFVTGWPDAMQILALRTATPSDAAHL
ncbi:hypothetical protein AB0E55_07080 [Amycolatopsis keratiniphila]|uniref:hypothetical protein n=1 Tax=Amycolatopsis keratiniphila TaxID=129921 RepID=UPI0033D53690